MVETRLVHETHRVASSLLSEAAVRPSVPLELLGTFRDYLVANLRHHHTTEDEWLWPRLLDVVPAAELEALSEEHARLDTALDQLDAVHTGRAELRAAAIEVRDRVHDHLAHEEPVLMPVLRAHISPAQWDAFARRVMATTPPVAGHLTIGLFDEVGTPAEVEWLLAGLPEPMRPLVPDLRRQAAHDLRVLRGTETAA